MVIDAVLVACGLAVLTIAADQLVLGSSRLATGLRISPVVVGVVIIGLGTSAPELLVSGVAAAKGDAAMAIGNLMGSNLLNVTLILGVAGLVAPVAVRSGTIRREIPLAGAAVVLLAISTTLGLTVITGVVLLTVTVGALILLVRWSRASTGGEAELDTQVAEFTDGVPKRRLGIEAARAALGLVGVLAGAQLLVTGAVGIAGRLGVSQVVIGFSLVALGTSLPELVTTIQAQRRRETDLVVGNLFGSNLFNSLAGGAVVGLATGAGPAARVAGSLLVAMVLVMALAWAMLRRGLRLTRPEALVLLGAYALTLPLLLG